MKKVKNYNKVNIIINEENPIQKFSQKNLYDGSLRFLGNLKEA